MNRQEMLEALNVDLCDEELEQLAIKLSIKKWKDNLAKVKANIILEWEAISSTTCALCELYCAASSECISCIKSCDECQELCDGCPLKEKFGLCKNNTWVAINNLLVAEILDRSTMIMTIIKFIEELESLESSDDKPEMCYGKVWHQ